MMESPFRILFAGNPEIAVPALVALSNHFTVCGVLTNPDKPSGRGRKLEMPPVKKQALKLGIPVLQFDSLGLEARIAVAALMPNFLVSFACGHYFGPKFLHLFDKGSVNIHPSLLPLYRGCSPIQFALLHGKKETGITIQRIAKEIDSGSLLLQKQLPLVGNETTQSLSHLVANEAAVLIVETLTKLGNGEIQEHDQIGQASWTTMIEKTDAIIDWNQSARLIHCMIRAYYPWPKASTVWEGKDLFITGVWGIDEQAGLEANPSGSQVGQVVGFDKTKGLAVACNDGLLYVNRLQLAQKKELASRDFVNGNPSIIGSLLG
ncbi:MAG: methionyl-tRNA formyltransferase [Sphaerochaetaceae bacterium]